MTDVQVTNSNSENPSAVVQTFTSHFWVSSGPFFESTLITSVPIDACDLKALRPAGSADESLVSASLRFYDADGFLVNEVNSRVSVGKVSVMELDPLLGTCKFESGLRHAHLEVISDRPLKNVCRLHSQEGATLSGQLIEIGGTRRTFLPLVFALDRLSLMPLVNFNDEEVLVRGRLFCGNRSPEASWSLPPRATRLIDLGSEFEEFYDCSDGARLQAYIRVGVRTQHLVGVQLIERVKGAKEGNLFIGLS